MRLIGTVNSESDARRFGDFLVSAAMRNHVEQSTSGAWQIWIEHDDHVDQAIAQFRAYEANPNDPKYADADAAARKVRRDEALAAERRRRQFTDVRTSWSGAKIRPTPLASAILGVCVVLFLITFALSPEAGARLKSALAFQPFESVVALEPTAIVRAHPLTFEKHRPATMFSAIASGQFWRLATPALMHGDILHLVFNMMWLATLGRTIESRRGTGFFFSLVLISAIISCSGEALWTVYGPVGDGWSFFLGFSGVNYALFGYAWIAGKLRPYEGIGVSQQTIGLLLGWLFVCMTGLLGPIANAAHVVGLAVGCAIAAWPLAVRKMKAR